MKERTTLLLICAVLAITFLATPLHSVEINTSRATAAPRYGDELMVSVRVTGGDGTVFEQGDRVKLSFQTSEDAYVILFNIDSEGYINLLYPSNGELRRSKANKVYFLPENGSGQYWSIGGATGVEYIHAVAVRDRSTVREEELRYLADDRRRPENDRLRIDGDPYLAFNSIDENIVKGARENPPATGHTYFFINREVDYPRYLCSKCHAPGKLTDPYNMDCPEIVVERFAYETEPQYPYPPLFDITYETGETGDDYYISDKYAEKYYEEQESGSEPDIYLSIYYSDYSYPYRYYYPYNRFSTYDPFWFDFYWYWDFGFTGFYTGYYYHYWPFASWYYPSYYSAYWYPSYYPYPYYDWGYYYPPDCTYPSYRPIHSDRSISKRTTLDYASTQTDIMRDTAISGSALMRSKSRASVRDASNTRSSGRSGSVNRSGTKSYDTDRYRSSIGSRTDVRGTSSRRSDLPPSTTKRVVHGDKRSRDPVRSRDPGRQSGSTIRRSDDRSTPYRPSTPEKRTERKPTGKSQSTRSGGSRSSSEGTKQVERKKSSSPASSRQRNANGTRKSSSTRKSTDERKSSGDRSKSPPKSRNSSAGSRSSSRSSSPARSSSGSSRSSSGGSRSSGGSGKSRKR